MRRLPLFYSIIFLTGIVLCIGCRDTVKDTGMAPTPQEVDTTLVTSMTDTEITILPLSNSSSRVAWQKPDLILRSFGDNLEHKTIADIGAGPTGFFTYWLAQRGAYVLAIDIDPSALAYIETEKTKVDTAVAAMIKTRLAKPQDPRLKPREADGILIVNTIAYISDKGRYLAELLDKLKANGKLVIVDFKMKRLPEQIAPPRSERVHADVLEELLYKSGYKNILVDDQSLEYQYIITANK